jgi:hypothetical protein
MAIIHKTLIANKTNSLKVDKKNPESKKTLLPKKGSKIHLSKEIEFLYCQKKGITLSYFDLVRESEGGNWYYLRLARFPEENEEVFSVWDMLTTDYKIPSEEMEEEWIKPFSEKVEMDDPILIECIEELNAQGYPTGIKVIQ